jgi:chromate transporter
MAALWELLLGFGQIGLFALGGGGSMIKLIEEVSVDRYGWVTAEQFASLVGASYLFPGLTAVKLAGMIGLKVAGVPGLLIGVFALNLPGIVLAGAFYAVVVNHQDSPIVRKLLTAMQYAAIALLASAVYALARPLVAPSFSWVAGGLAVTMFAAVAVFDVSPFLALIVFITACLLLL